MHLSSILGFCQFSVDHLCSICSMLIIFVVLMSTPQFIHYSFHYQMAKLFPKQSRIFVYFQISNDISVQVWFQSTLLVFIAREQGMHTSNCRILHQINLQSGELNQNSVQQQMSAFAVSYLPDHFHSDPSVLHITQGETALFQFTFI